MFCVSSWCKFLSLVLLVAVLAACGDLTDDLLPDSDDKRAAVSAGTTGYMPGQLAADFTVSTSNETSFQLADHLSAGSAPADVVVLYFTMWCPICLAHSDHLYNVVIPQFAGRGTVVYGLVDYVSGSVSASRASELANGYAGSEFVTLVDSEHVLMDQFNGAMGTVVVIDADGTILMNEGYRNGAALIDILEQQLP